MDGIRINGQLNWVDKPEDFADLVDKYMGYDSAKYFDSILAEWESLSNTVDYYGDCADELEDANLQIVELEDKIRDLENQIEELENTICDLEDKLDNPRLQN